MAESVSREDNKTVLKSADDTELVAPSPVSAAGESLDSGKSAIESSLSGTVLLERFELREVLGSGAWSTVYKGWHNRLNKPIAVKCLHSNLVSTVERLKRFALEAKTVGTLNHGNIVRVYDYGCYQDNQPFTVMELIDGPPLSEILKTSTTITPGRCAELCSQVAEALNYAHARGVVHRDIKPENILIEHAGADKEVAKLADFGIVKAIMPDEGQTELTQTGEIIGTPQYMSPEQCSGKAIDGRSDIYSLGCLMFESLTGRHLFAGRTAFDCMRKHLEEPAPLLFNDDDITAEKRCIQDIVLCCLEKQPVHRPSAAQLSRCLSLFLRKEYNQVARLLNSIRESDKQVWYTQPKAYVAIAGVIGLCAVLNMTGMLHPSKPHTKAGVSNSAAGINEPLTENSLQSYEAALNLAFDEIRYGLAHFGNSAEAARLKSELSAFRSQLDTGRGPFPASSPLQVVSIGHTESVPGESSPPPANVVVSYTDSPVVLLLRSKTDTKWNVEVRPGATISQIYVVGPEGKPQEIVGAPPQVPIKLVNESAELGKIEPNPEYNDRASFLRNLERITGKPVAAYQGSSVVHAGEQWIVGPESKEWRAQMILHQLGSLHARALEPARQQLLQWFATKKVPVAFAGSTAMQAGSLVAPRKSFDFVPGSVASSWKPSADEAFGLVPDAVKYPVSPYTISKLVRAGGTSFSLCAEGIVRLQAGAAPKLMAAPQASNQDAGFEATDYDFVFASRANKLLVKNRSHFYSVDANTGLWQQGARIRAFIDRDTKNSNSAPPTLQGMAYIPAKDNVYFLDKGGDSGLTDVARYLSKYSIEGEPLSRLPLSCRIPIKPSGADGFTQMFYAQPYLIAVSSAPYESGSWFDRDTYMMREQDPRRYIWIMDPETATVILSAPLSTNAQVHQSDAPEGPQ